MQQLQDSRTVRKICALDAHVYLAIMRVERDQKGQLCPKMVSLTQEDTDKLVKQIEEERQAEQEKKKAKAASSRK